MSVTDIEYNQKNKTLEIAIQMFTDDLEEALEETISEQIQLGMEDEHTKTDIYIQNYLSKNFKLSIDKTSLTYDFIGKEVDLNDTYCYIEVLNIETLNTLTITNKVLIDTFTGQKNMVNVKKGKKTKALLLKGHKTSGTVTF